MKVTKFNGEGRVATIELTRRNLLVLLKKLDHVANGGESRCEIISPMFGDVIGVIAVKAVEDDEHYVDRDPGPMLDNETGVTY